MFQLFAVNSKPINHKVYKYLCEYWQPITANKLQRHIVRIAQWLDHTSGTKGVQLGYSPKNQQQLSLPLKKNHQNWWLEDDPFLLKWSFFWDMLVFRGGTFVVKYSLGWFFLSQNCTEKMRWIRCFELYCLLWFPLPTTLRWAWPCGIKSPSHHIKSPRFRLPNLTCFMFHVSTEMTPACFWLAVLVDDSVSWCLAGKWEVGMPSFPHHR